jgi:biopolymer transport protein TolR
MRRRPVRSLYTEVNVTPLVDVMLVLLVIFILVAPILSQGIDVKLPEASTGTSEPEGGLHVSLGADGQIFFDGKPMLPQRVDDEFRRRAEKDPGLAVIVEGDARLDYGIVMDVLDRARIAGLTRVSLATEPRREHR